MPGDIPQSPRWSALLMAGGESRRMGSDKALLEINGEPLWRRQLRTLREAGFTEVIITRGSNGEIGGATPGLIKVTDAVAGCGPLGGLVGGLRHVTTRWLLVLAVDMPLMPSWFLREMMAMTDADERGRALAPVVEKRGEPLAAIYPTQPACFYGERALRRGRLSLQDLMKELVSLDFMRELEVRAENREFFRNVNTPEDLAEIESRLAKERGRLAPESARPPRGRAAPAP